MPSRSRGTQKKPSAPARVVMSPDLPQMGTAHSPSGFSSRVTPVYWALPWLAGTVWARRADTVRSAQVRPSSRASRGMRKSFAVNRAATGWPGRPRMGLPPAFPSRVGLPGFMATPWHSTSPREAITRQAASFSPTELPPDSTTQSQVSRAFSIASLSSSSRSGTMPRGTASAPAWASRAATRGPFTSRTCPGPGSPSGGTSSSPVEMRPTRSLGTTGT